MVDQLMDRLRCAGTHRVTTVTDTCRFNVAADAMAIALGSLPTAEGAWGSSIAAVGCGWLSAVAFAV